ncbi:M16 family metallopeptidase [Hydrogenophaga soli]
MHSFRGRTQATVLLGALVAALAVWGPQGTARAQAPVQAPWASSASALVPTSSVSGAQRPVWQRVGPVFQTVLPNGFTLLVQPDRRAPTAVHMLWVRVGSTDEVDGTSGVAHVLEHMMFKGTPTVKPGEYSRRIAALGGRDNAFTSRDMTAYHQQLPANQLEEAMRLEADRFAHNQWSDDEFRREIEVIKEERRQRIDDQPAALLGQALAATAWQAHPYRRPVIGWMSDLESLQPDDVRQFHRRWYVPANAAIVVAGDVDPDQVLELALRHYGPIPAGMVPERRPQTEPTQVGQRSLQLKAAAEQAQVILAYAAPNLSDPAAGDADSRDALALTLLAAVLDGHEGARLGRALIQRTADQRLTDQAGAGYSGGGRGPAQFLLDATPAAGRSVVEVVAALQAEVRRVAEQGVTEAELNRVKNQWRAAEVYKLDAVFAQARQLGGHWVAGWPADADRLLMDSLMRITPQDVQAVAQRILNPDRLTQAELVPDAQALAQRRAAASQRPRLDIRH